MMNRNQNRRVLALIMLVGSLALPAAGQAATDTDGAAAKRPCIGLVLGGGGARGAAHVGVLKVLERERIPVCRIAGTSMGAIVGGLYATGYDASELATLVDDIDWGGVLDDDPPRKSMPMRRKDNDFKDLLDLEIGYKHGRIVLPGGLVQGQKLQLLLRRLTLSTSGVDGFDALPIPFRAVSTDIVSGRPVVFSSGDLATAMRSSMSVPGAFAPVQRDGQLLVDGGIVDNVPIDVARDMGADVLVAVDVGSPLVGPDKLSNPAAVLNQMITAMMQDKTSRALETLGPGDVLITPDLGDITSTQFNRGAEAIALGERAAEAVVPQLRRYALGAPEYAAYRQQQHKRDFDPGLIAFLDVMGADTGSGRYVARKAASLTGKAFDVDEIEKTVDEIYGRGSFQEIDYKPVQHDGEQGIELIPRDKPWGPTFGKLGFQLDNNFAGSNNYQLSAQVTATDLNSLGAEWRNTVQLGRVQGWRSEFYQPFGALGDFYLQPALDIHNESLPLWLDGQQVAEYRIQQREVGIEGGWSPAPQWRLALALLRGRDKGDLLVGLPDVFDEGAESYAAVVANTTWDTLDDANFPATGTRARFGYETYHALLGGRVKGDVARLTVNSAHAWGRYHLLLGLHMSSVLGDGDFYHAQDFLGGFLNLSGYEERSLLGSQSALARAIVYRRTGDTSKLFSLPLYFGGSLEAGNAWSTRSDVRLDTVKLAGSLFTGMDTPLGPLFLAYGYSEGGHYSFYLTFGSLLRPR